MPVKKRVVIFGAGGGGRKFFINCKDHYDFIAFCDNASALHGQSIHSLPVVRPEKIIQLEFDLIVIASMWVKEIAEQLEQMNIPNHKVCIPPKNLLKNGTPFAHIKTKKIARKSIFILHELSTKLKIDLYVDFGTLLGFARQGDILDWDDDIDLSINEFDFDALKFSINQIQGMLSVESTLWKCFLVHDTDGNRYGLLLECAPEEGKGADYKPFDIYIRSRRRVDGFSIPMGAVGNLYIPEEHFNGFDRLFFQGKLIKGPKNHSKYLEKVYGDWRTPRKNINFSFYAPVNLAPFGKTDSSPLQKKRIF